MCVRLVSLCRWLACAVGGNGSDCFLAAVLSFSAKLYLLSLNLFYCISLLLFKTSFSTFLFSFQFELMCEVHPPKSKHNSFQLIIFDLDKIDSVLQMQFIWKDQFVIVYRPQLYLV